MQIGRIFLWAFLQVFAIKSAFGFIPPLYHGSKLITTERSNLHPPVSSSFVSRDMQLPVGLKRQRFSVARVQTMGLFGLGLPEIAIVLVVGAFLLGPEKIGNIAGSVKGAADGGIPDELKKIPEEFKKGVEEGESNARARAAKPMVTKDDLKKVPEGFNGEK
jgi:sec-independent protein translocase protein TatA